MDDQLRSDEREYFYELENLLARFHHDLERVKGATRNIGHQELVDVLEKCQWNVGVACCIAAEEVQSRSRPVSVRA